MSLCPKCKKCPVCCQRSTCGRPSATVLAGLALPGLKSEGSLHPQGRVPTPLQEETTPSKISCNSQWFIKSIRKQKSERGIAVSRSKTGYRKGVSSIISGLLQPVVPGSKTQQKVEAHSRSKPNEPLPCSGNVQDGNSGDHQTLSTAGGVGHFARFQRRLFSHPHKPQVAKISQVSLQRSDISVPFGLSTAPLEFTKVVKEVQLMAQAQGIRIHQYLDNWLLRAPCQETYLRHTQTLLDLCHSLGCVVNMNKSELVPQQTFDFVGYHFDLSQGLVKPTQERWRSLSQKLNLLLGLESCTVRQFMSLIGLLTATEKQVVSG